MDGTRETGVVVRFGNGWGFIAPTLGGKDVFVSHAEAPADADGWRNLVPGQRVTFTRGTDRSGRPCAVDVRNHGEE